MSYIVIVKEVILVTNGLRSYEKDHNQILAPGNAVGKKESVAVCNFLVDRVE